MASCECCRNEALQRYVYDLSEEYNRVMSEHQDNKCVCTQDTPEGDQARAGQFWVDGKDTRKEKCG